MGMRASIRCPLCLTACPARPRVFGVADSARIARGARPDSYLSSHTARPGPRSCYSSSSRASSQSASEPPVIAELYVCFIARSVLSRHPLVPLSTRPHDNFKRRGEAHGTRPVSPLFSLSAEHLPFISARIGGGHVSCGCLCVSAGVCGSGEVWIVWGSWVCCVVVGGEVTERVVRCHAAMETNTSSSLCLTLPAFVVPERKLWSHSCRARVGADTLRVCGGLWIRGEVTGVDRCLTVQLEWGCRTSYRTSLASLPV